MKERNVRMEGAIAFELLHLSITAVESQLACCKRWIATGEAANHLRKATDLLTDLYWEVEEMLRCHQGLDSLGGRLQ